MKIIKNFSIFKKAPSDNSKTPSHSISANTGTQENPEYVDIGSAWTKDGNKGKFLSAQLSQAWTNTEDNTKSRKAFVIVYEEDLNELMRLAKLENDKIIDPTNGNDLTPDDSNPF